MLAWAVCSSSYGTLLVVDTEEEFFPAEVAKLQDDVMKEGLSVLVLADWYNVGVIDKARFFDVSTRSWWTPVTGYVAPMAALYMVPPSLTLLSCCSLLPPSSFLLPPSSPPSWPPPSGAAMCQH